VKNTTLQRVKEDSGSSTSKEYLRIDLKVDSVTLDRMWLFNQRGCTPRFDNGWDGPKMMPGEGVPAIYSVEEDGKYQVNTVNDMNGTQIGLQKGSGTEYKLAFHSENLSNRYLNVSLFDVKENKTIDISNEGAEYLFTVDQNENTNQRFKIIVNYNSNGKSESLIRVFSSKANIYVENQSEEKGTVFVYDISGHEINEQTFFEGTTKLLNQFSSGIYVVKTITSSETAINKIIVP
jgi:hypothetical protein